MQTNPHVKPYADFLLSKADLKRPLKIIADCSNGPTALVISELRERFSPHMEITAMNDGIDPDFPAHGPDPSEASAAAGISKKILENQADIGIIFDGDGDRAVFLDEKGRIIPAQEIAAFLIHNTPGIHVADTLIYQALIHTDPSLKSRVKPSKVGRYFINKELRAQNGVIGAEFSGHFYFAEFFGADSAMLMMIKVLNALSIFDKPLSVILERFSGHVVSAAKIATESPFEGLREKVMKGIVKGKKPLHVSDEDGLTIDLGDSWINMRPSNTEPVVRITAGAKNAHEADAVIKEYRALLLS